ncbi:hypothetical protein GCM10028809_06560 [Spirosoma gilvum]
MSHSSFVKNYVGDALWALMVFLGFGILFRHWSTGRLALVAFFFSAGIEFSQLYHAPWIDHLRATRLGGLVLGFTFIWSDLICYAVGIGVGALAEHLLLPTYSTNHQHKPVQSTRTH